MEFGDYFRHVMSWYGHKDDANVLFITYEQLKQDVGRCIVDIGRFIGGKSAKLVDDPANVERIIKSSDFKEMKKRGEVENNEATAEFQKNPHKDFFRKGGTGDFTNWLKKEQYARLNEVYQKMMKGTSLIDLWKPYVTYEKI